VLLLLEGRGSPERVPGNLHKHCPTATADHNKGLANEGHGNVPVTVAKKTSNFPVLGSHNFSRN
jgi:hypothetical protein